MHTLVLSVSTDEGIYLTHIYQTNIFLSMRSFDDCQYSNNLTNDLESSRINSTNVLHESSFLVNVHLKIEHIHI